jgi:hypothetical protein
MRNATCRKLVIGVVVASLLIWAEGTTADDYVWSPEPPLGSRLWNSPQNWGGLGYPGPGDTAYIESPPSLGPLIDTDVHVYRIIGPIGNASGVDQVMDVIGDANVLVDDWDARDTGGAVMTVTFAGSSRVRVNSRMRWVDNGSAIIHITDDAQLTVQEWQMGDEPNGYAELHMDGGRLETFGGDLKIAEAGSGIFDFGGTARVAVARMLGIRAQAATSTGRIDVSGNADITADEVRVGWGGGHVIMNVNGGTVTTEKLTMAAGSNAQGLSLLNVNGGIITAANSLEAPANADAQGRCVINLSAGVIETGQFTHETSNWTLDICRGGTMVLHGDVRADIYRDISTGHIIACAGNQVVNVDLIDGNTVITASGAVYHVDTLNGNDWNTGFTRPNALQTIQQGIDAAGDSDVVLLWPGVYVLAEPVDFVGKAIMVQSAADPAVVEAPGDYAFWFHTAENKTSVLRNVIIRNCPLAVICEGASPTISNLTIVDNEFGIAAYDGAAPDIANCIFWNNANGDLFQCHARYSRLQDPAVTEPAANIGDDPLFADPSQGDYHLLSEIGRFVKINPADYNVPDGHWVPDAVTSPCVDMGDPMVNPMREAMPNGGRLNMGAYGGTAYASMSEWPLVGDVNFDGAVDSLDIRLLSQNWLQIASDVAILNDGTADGMVNFVNYAIVTENWLHALPWAKQP